MYDGAKDRQIATYRQLALFNLGNDVVTELCRTFAYRWLLPSKRKAKQRTLPAHYQSVVLAWLILTFLSDLYIKGRNHLQLPNETGVLKVNKKPNRIVHIALYT
jgi:hypothetical protein